MLFGPITDVECTLWQRQAATVLAELLRDAARAELPCIHWQLGAGRTLVAKCMTGDAEQRRTAFVAWAAFLGIADWRAWDSTGVTYLHGSADDFRAGCRVVINADLYQELSEAGERP